MQHDIITKQVIPVVEMFDSFQPSMRYATDGSVIYGFGFKHDDDGQLLSSTTLTITRAQALSRLKAKLVEIIDAITPMINTQISVYQMTAMVDYAYDLGIEKFKQSGIVSYINAGQNQAVRQALMLGVFTKKNDKTMLCKTREKRRKLGCKYWDKQQTIKE